MAGKEKFPRASEIPWDKIQEVRVTSDSGNFSFEFDFKGKKQRMTITTSPESTSFTISTQEGEPIVHATQKGREIRILDFSSRPSKSEGKSRLRAMRPKKA